MPKRKDANLEINDCLTQIMENLRVYEQVDRTAMKGLTIQELHTIALVKRLGRPRMSELAERGHVTRGAASIMIRKLVRKGFIERDRGGEDLRVVNVKLTARGEAVAKDHEAYHEQINAKVMAVLTASEKGQVARVLRKILTVLE
jgi:DNA-binding MarR family transcriptional regulator